MDAILDELERRIAIDLDIPSTGDVYGALRAYYATHGTFRPLTPEQTEGAE
jgi:hypothetical protein